MFVAVATLRVVVAARFVVWDAIDARGVDLDVTSEVSACWTTGATLEATEAVELDATDDTELAEEEPEVVDDEVTGAGP